LFVYIKNTSISQYILRNKLQK